MVKCEELRRFVDWAAEVWTASEGTRAVSQGAEPFTSEDLRAVPRETRSTPRGEGGSKQTDHLSLLYV